MSSRDLLLYGGGVLIVVLAVAGWLWWTTPDADTLPQQYKYGVL